MAKRLRAVIQCDVETLMPYVALLLDDEEVMSAAPFMRESCERLVARINEALSDSAEGQ
jgi:hypothetical protein